MGVEQGKQHVTAAALQKLPRWRKVAPLAKSFIGNTLHMMGEHMGGPRQVASLGWISYCCVLHLACAGKSGWVEKQQTPSGAG